MVKILVFGHSIAYGAYDFECGGWVDRLKAFFFKDGQDCKVYNCGISGDKTEDVLMRFEFETKQRLKEEKKTIFIFDIVTNDSAFIRSKNNFWVTPKKFKENIEKLIKLAQKFSSKIIFLGPIPVDELKTTPIPWNADVYYKNEFVKKYNEIVKSVCKEKKVFFVEMFDRFSKSEYKNLLEDGVHPNTEGHKKIFGIVKNFLIKNKII